MIKTAVIMAAGMGTRFGKYTEQIPKGFVEVCGKPMIERSIETLISCGIERIVIGTGYKHEVYDFLKKKYPMIETCFSPLYAETNSMYTLYNTQGLIGSDDFLLLESDLVFETKAITELMNCGKPGAFQGELFVSRVGKGVGGTHIDKVVFPVLPQNAWIVCGASVPVLRTTGREGHFAEPIRSLRYLGHGMYNLRGYHPSRMERQALGKAGNEHMVLAVISFHYRTSPGPIAFALESWCTWSFV